MVATIDEAKDIARAAATEPIDRILDRLGENVVDFPQPVFENAVKPQQNRQVEPAQL